MAGGGDVEGSNICVFCGLSAPEIQALTSTAAGAAVMQCADLMCASASWPTTALLPGSHTVTNRRGIHARGVRARDCVQLQHARDRFEARSFQFHVFNLFSELH